MFIPHLAQILKALHSLLQKGIRWDWDETCAAAFTAAKRAVRTIQALSIKDPSRPFELDVHVMKDGCELDLWQLLKKTCQTIGF